MREMKDSRIEWVGAIPQNWQLSKIGSLYTQRNEKVSDKDYQPLSVTMQGILPQLATAAKTDDGDNRKLVGLETLQSTAALTVVVLVVFLR